MMLKNSKDEPIGFVVVKQQVYMMQCLNSGLASGNMNVYSLTKYALDAFVAVSLPKKLIFARDVKKVKMSKKLKLLSLGIVTSSLIVVPSLAGTGRNNQVAQSIPKAEDASQSKECSDYRRTAFAYFQEGGGAANKEEALQKYNQAKELYASHNDQGGVSLVERAIEKVDDLPFSLNRDVIVAKERRVIFLARRDGLTEEVKRAEKRIAQLEKMIK